MHRRKFLTGIAAMAALTALGALPVEMNAMQPGPQFQVVGGNRVLRTNDAGQSWQLSIAFDEGVSVRAIRQRNGIYTAAIDTGVSSFKLRSADGQRWFTAH